MPGVERPLWSARQRGGGSLPPLSVHTAAEWFSQYLEQLQDEHQLQEWFGYECVDAGYVPGRLGPDPALRLQREHGVEGVWPPSDHWEDWDQDTLFDAIELFGRFVSIGVEDTGFFHSYCGCGWHYRDFNHDDAFAAYRTTVNPMLARIGDGFELTESGTVERLPPAGMDGLLRADADTEPLSEEGQIAAAIEKFGRPRLEAKREAVQILADLLEPRRKQVRESLGREGDRVIFEIANKMWIRHNKDDQVRDYDHDAWWDWLFYFYLASLRLLQTLDAHSAGRSGAVADLISDLARSTFRAGDLAQRLTQLELSGLPQGALRNLGIAVGRRAAGKTFTVSNDGVKACARSADLEKWPPPYRLGVVEGLFLGVDGQLLPPRELAGDAVHVLAPLGDDSDVLSLLERVSKAPMTAAATSSPTDSWTAAERIRGALAAVDQPSLRAMWEEIASRFATAAGHTG